MATTSSDSPDTLPIVGYSRDQLSAYIMRQLGAPVWEIEITKQQILDCIEDSLILYCQYKPALRYQAVKMTANQFQYFNGVDLGFSGMPGLGIVDVSFVEPNIIPNGGLGEYYGNLITNAPLIGGGLGDYDTYARWRKTWMRVTSLRPDWLYDEVNKILYIHNPIERFHCGVTIYAMWNIDKLPVFGADWVKQYATQKARALYGEILSKFSGALPGPVKDLQLDTAKRDKAEEKLKELKATLVAAQESTPMMID